MSAMPRPRPFVLARTESFLITFAALLLSASVPAQQPDEAGWIAFAEGENRPAIEVVINGEKTIALIDTAISANAISFDFAERAGIKRGPRTLSLPDIQDGERQPLSGKFTLELAGNPVELDSAVMIPAKDVGLVVGRPLLNELVVQIDYPNRKLRFLPPDAADFEGNLRIRRGRFNQPMVETRINDKRTWMTLDTSNQGVCLLTDRIVAKREWRGPKVEAEKLRAAGIAVRPDVQTMRLDHLKLGPFNIEDVIVATPAEDSTDSDDYGARRIHEKFGGDGILGHEVMRHFVFTIALGEDNVHLYAQ